MSPHSTTSNTPDWLVVADELDAAPDTETPFAAVVEQAVEQERRDRAQRMADTRREISGLNRALREATGEGLILGPMHPARRKSQAAEELPGIAFRLFLREPDALKLGGARLAEKLGTMRGFPVSRSILYNRVGGEAASRVSSAMLENGIFGSRLCPDESIIVLKGKLRSLHEPEWLAMPKGTPVNYPQHGLAVGATGVLIYGEQVGATAQWPKTACHNGRSYKVHRKGLGRPFIQLRQAGKIERLYLDELGTRPYLVHR